MRPDNETELSELVHFFYFSILTSPGPVQASEKDLPRLLLKVGRIVAVKRHPEAEKLYVETIDLGGEKPVTVVSGLVDYIPIERMQVCGSNVLA